MKQHKNPSIGIAYCTPTEENGNWCKSKDEIDAWLLTHPNYFVYQVTRVESETWHDNQNEKTGHPGDSNSYFPTHNSVTSYNFGPIKVDPNMREQYLEFDEISFNIETITIDDSFTSNATRSREFMNVAKTR